jgi:hypothetical protein
MVRIHAYCARGRGFDPRTVQTFVRMNMSVCIVSVWVFSMYNMNLHIYHSRFIPEEVAEVSRVFLPDSYDLPKLLSYEEYCRRDRW